MTQILDISGNYFSTVPDQDWARVAALQSLQNLNMSFSEIQDLTWLSSKSLIKLQATDNAITKLPKFGTAAPKLQVLNLANNPLKQVNAIWFANMTSLLELSLSNCGVSELQDHVFDSVPSLLTINIDRNPLTALSRAVLSTHLSKLNFMSVTQSTLTEAAIDISQLLNLQAMFWTSDFCPNGFFGVGQTVCLRCPDGTFKPAGPDGRPACVACGAGTSDVDFHPQTECQVCPAGTYAAPGSSGACQQCAAGTTDADNDPSTPCVACGPGFYALPGATGLCVPCTAGTTDVDNSAATPCVACGAGTYVDIGSTGECVQHNCTAGSIDDDLNASTPCVPCGEGHFVPDGQSGPCEPFECTGGTEDDDHNPATPCTRIPQTVAAAGSSNSATVGAVVGSLVAIVTLLCLVLVYLWWARRQRWREKNKPFSFDDALAELRRQGLAGSAPLGLDGQPRELRRGAVRLLDSIGEGAFGTVYKALVDERSTTGVPEYTVAVKVLKDEPTSGEIKEFMREAAIMAQFQHPNVVSLIGVVTVGDPAMLVLQFCEHGSLLSFLRKHIGFQQLQLGSKYSLMADIARGMDYLASRNVVHRDLAARNVLVGSDFVCKVSDFGLSREVDSNSADYYSSAKGKLPLRWTAPEALQTRHFSTWSDIWSFGILCGEVFDNGEKVRRCGVFFFAHCVHILPVAAICGLQQRVCVGLLACR
jgi:hypothetical protein